MTEQEWLSSDDPTAMLAWITNAVRGVTYENPTIENGQRLISDRKRRLFAEACAEGCVACTTYIAVESRSRQAEYVAGASCKTRKLKAALLREIVGNPWKKVVQPCTKRVWASDWLTWNDGTVPRMAQRIYEDRLFDDTPMLADALEDAGCTDEEILRHCRSGLPHVRGCWVLDLLLGKE